MPFQSASNDKDNKDEGKDEYAVHSGFKLLPEAKMAN